MKSSPAKLDTVGLNSPEKRDHAKLEAISETDSLVTDLSIENHIQAYNTPRKNQKSHFNLIKVAEAPRVSRLSTEGPESQIQKIITEARSAAKIDI